MIALTEWSLTPEYINEHWTEELLALMFESRKKWIQRATDKREKDAYGVTRKRLSNSEWFAKHKVNVIKVG